MASIFGHIISSLGLGSIFPSKVMTPKVYLIGAISASIPDIDVISSYFGIWGLDILGHRGITHSISFAFIWAIVLLILFHKNSKYAKTLFLFYFISTLSHGLIDGLTSGGDGIAYFAPFSAYRTHLPLELIEVSPLGIENFISPWGLKVLVSEFFWIGLPSLGLIFLSKLVRTKR